VTRTLNINRIAPKQLVAFEAPTEELVGQVVVDFKLQINNLAEQFLLSNQEIKKYYFDPFVTKEKEIAKNCEMIEKMSLKKIPELNEIYHSID